MDTESQMVRVGEESRGCGGGGGTVGSSGHKGRQVDVEIRGRTHIVPLVQIGATLPANNPHVFQARISDGGCNYGSLLNPLGRACYTKSMMTMTTTTRSTRHHLSNLEKLLGTEPHVIVKEPEVDRRGRSEQEPISNREKRFVGRTEFAKYLAGK
ncbi:hypothetical protein L1987_56550 [Smallanthus sonchifolius]|uniref:Uncharacterized protein n=1 Tax=Smallanthus sonchifolius TaxID=185202 RepID=A0ACB9ECH4_9ASTR|nr:hypothetical protein L1987_56550 [Smallanthus sonchifolius]